MTIDKVMANLGHSRDTEDDTLSKYVNNTVKEKKKKVSLVAIIDDTSEDISSDDPNEASVNVTGSTADNSDGI